MQGQALGLITHADVHFEMFHKMNSGIGGAQRRAAASGEHVSVCVFVLFVFAEATEGEAQDMTPVLVNGSPKLPRLPMPSAMDHESFDITLHRKDTEGFGFVILTSKSKPPYGGRAFRKVCIRGGVFPTGGSRTAALSPQSGPGLAPSNSDGPTLSTFSKAFVSECRRRLKVDVRASFKMGNWFSANKVF